MTIEDRLHELFNAARGGSDRQNQRILDAVRAAYVMALEDAAGIADQYWARLHHDSPVIAEAIRALAKDVRP